jgi:lysozyme
MRGGASRQSEDWPRSVAPQVLKFLNRSKEIAMSSQNKAAGIDVSHYQGNVDWDLVKAAGISFAFAKATESTTYVDSQFKTNWQGLKSAGLLRGAYHFFQAGSDAAAQAENFIKTIGALEPVDLPPVLDIESAGSATNSQIIAGLQTWLDTVEQGLGRKPMIYTNASFWNAHLNNQFGNYPLWIAHYDVASPKIPAGWSEWNFWQYSQTGHVQGVSGSVDTDWYNGTYQDLLAFLQAPPDAVKLAAPASQPVTATNNSYTVQAGDTLSRIAAQFGVTVDEISEANNIENPNQIEVGQVLAIP